MADSNGGFYLADSGCFNVRYINSAGIVSSVAGTGVAGNSGDGGLATDAQLNDVRAIAVDKQGNLFIADYAYNIIRKVDTNGIITTVAGNGTAGYSGDGGSALQAMISGPRGLVVDAAGNLFISDYDNGVVRKVTPAGVISTVAGTGVAGYSGDGGAATSAQLIQAVGPSA